MNSLMRALVIVAIVSLVLLAGCGGNTAQTVNGQPPPLPSPTGNSSVPTIMSLSPIAATAGGPAFTLAVLGSNFVASSVVRWNGSDRPTAFQNSTQVTAQIPASDIAAIGTSEIGVFNPAPGGGLSNSLTFSIITGVGGPHSVALAPDSSGKFGKFAYVVSEGSAPSFLGRVSTYTIDATTGALSLMGTMPAGAFSVSAGVDPSGKFAYIANLDSDTVSMYTIDQTTGVLTSMGTIGSTGEPDSVVVHPSGKFAYVANYGDDLLGSVPGSVSMYRINADGSLTTIGKIAEAFVGTMAVAVHPSGKFAYVANAGRSNTISMYTIDATTGALTSAGTIAAGTLPESVAVDPSGKFAYAANAESNNVSMYTINATTGALTSAGTIAAGTLPYSVAVDPSGKFAYVANHGSNDVSMYTIDPTTGALTLIGTIGT